MNGPAEDRRAGVRSVAVCGSCITRDNFNSRFNAEHRRWYSVDAQANQSSMIAMMSPPVTPEVTEADGLSDYDTWNVRSDLSRSFLTDVVDAQPDFLLLDFFGDVHFGVLRLADGRYVTDNRWKLRKTAQYDAWKASGSTTRLTIREDPESYFPLWTEAMDRFAAYIAEHCPQTRVIVHRGFNVAGYVTGPHGRPRRLSGSTYVGPMRADRVNELWDRLDDHAVATYGWDSIDLRAERYTTYTEHPWGPYWVHYTLDYYPRFLAELHLRDLRTRLDCDRITRVEAIASVTRAHLVAQARDVRASLRVQDERIKELTERGPWRAATKASRNVRDAAAGLRPPGWASTDLPREPGESDPAYHRRLIADLLTSDLTAGLDPLDGDRIAAIARAGQERLDNQETRWSPLLAAGEARILELEALGRLKATKFALGQRIRQTRARWAAKNAPKKAES